MPDVAYFAKQAVQYLTSTAAKLRAQQADGHVPFLFPQVQLPEHVVCCVLPQQATQ